MNRDDRSSFALRLRTLRKQAHLTQADVADALNLHRTAYTKYETDKASPDHNCLLTLAELFHVSVDYLLGKNQETPEESLADDATIPLTTEELELIQAFRLLTEGQQRLLLQTERELLGITHTDETE